MNCKNCGAEPSSPPLIQFWKEYRVGSINSPDRFYLCPDCQGKVNPVELWAETAEAVKVKA